MSTEPEEGLSVSKEELERHIQDLSPDLPPLEINTEVRSMRICRGSPVPEGWIMVNDHWSPTSCGNPTSITYNVWTIERYSGRPIGSTMRVCAGAETPEGWVEIDRTWSPTRCGHPTSITNNVKVIRRVS